MRLIAGNAATVIVFAVLLLVTPITVTYPASPSEILWVFVVSLGVLIPNVAILTRTLAPLRLLDRALRQGSSPVTLESLPQKGIGEVGRLVTAYNDLALRLRQERQATAAAIMQAQEAERRRISRDLHDQIGQDLTGVLLSVADLARHPQPDGRERLDEVATRVRDTIEHVRSLATTLRPGLLDDVGLPGALVELVRRLETPGVRTTCQVDALAGLSADRDLAVFRIVQEALTNAIRHAGATRVDVSAERRPDAVVVRVTDDGHGLDAPAGLGITGMGERAIAIGAALSFESGDAGTTVRLTIPTGAA